MIKQRKILHVCGSLRTGGLETVALNCARIVHDYGIHSDFVVFGNDIGEYEKEAQELGCNIFHISSPKLGYLKYYKELRRIIKNNGPYDIVHSHIFFNSGIVMMAAARMGVKKRISHSHSVKRQTSNRIDKFLFYKLMRHFIKKYSTDICACSKKAGEYLFGKKVFHDKGVVLVNYINRDEFIFLQNNRKKIRDEFEINGNDIVLGQVGHLTSVKNQRFLLELFAAFLGQHNDSKLLIIGDGELKEELEALAKQLKIDKNVIFTGTRSDVGSILSALDVYVCTSTNEGFGLVLLEAFVNGLKVVINKETIVDEIEKLHNCYTVDGFDNIQKWIMEIERAIKNRGENSDKNLFNRYYSIDAFTLKLKKMYGF